MQNVKNKPELEEPKKFVSPTTESDDIGDDIQDFEDVGDFDDDDEDFY